MIIASGNQAVMSDNNRFDCTHTKVPPVIRQQVEHSDSEMHHFEFERSYSDRIMY